MDKTLPIKSTTERKIGNTTYIVEAIFSPKARETLEQKIIRLIQRELANGTFITAANVLQSAKEFEKKGCNAIPN